MRSPACVDGGRAGRYACRRRFPRCPAGPGCAPLNRAEPRNPVRDAGRHHRTHATTPIHAQSIHAQIKARAYHGPPDRTSPARRYLERNQRLARRRRNLTGGSHARIGSRQRGAREHALVWRLAASARVEEVLIAPGNAATGDLGRNLPDVPASDPACVREAARRHGVDLAVIGPEDALAAGVADLLREDGVAVVGPSAHAAPARVEQGVLQGVPAPPRDSGGPRPRGARPGGAARAAVRSSRCPGVEDGRSRPGQGRAGVGRPRGAVAIRHRRTGQRPAARGTVPARIRAVAVPADGRQRCLGTADLQRLQEGTGRRHRPPTPAGWARFARRPGWTAHSRQSSTRTLCNRRYVRCARRACCTGVYCSSASW